MEEILKGYFPDLTPRQLEQFSKLPELYADWNEKVNVISRKDIQNFNIHHLLHSLAIGKYLKFQPGSKVIDLGTGGGLPGIPLAILFPDVEFLLIDRIGKKVKVAEEIAKAIGLENVRFLHGDMGECKEKADFIVSRAVTDQTTLLKISRKNISEDNRNALPNGVIALKGGELHEELGKYAQSSEVVPISNYFNQPFFETKKIVYTPCR